MSEPQFNRHDGDKETIPLDERLDSVKGMRKLKERTKSLDEKLLYLAELQVDAMIKEFEEQGAAKPTCSQNTLIKYGVQAGIRLVEAATQEAWEEHEATREPNIREKIMAHFANEVDRERAGYPRQYGWPGDALEE